MLGSFLYPRSYVSSPALKPSYALLQDTLALHAKRRSTPACHLHARTMAPATWTACTSPAVAAQASRGRRVPSSLTSVPSARVLTAHAAAWAPATSASVIQVGSYIDSKAVSTSERRSPTECDIHRSGFLPSGAHVLVRLTLGRAFDRALLLPM